MIDRLEEHEAFLRAIFAAPEDDTPRLVYADFLEECGFPDRAELIRVQCELARLEAGGEESGERFNRLRACNQAAVKAAQSSSWWPSCGYSTFSRGFWEFEPFKDITVSAEDLSDPVKTRSAMVTRYPAVYGKPRLSHQPGLFSRPLGPDEVNVLFDLPFTQQVTDWDLGGHVEEVLGGPQTDDAGTVGLIDMIERPVITLRGVEALAAHRGARRIRSLILTHNQLGNDAVRALARSPHLIRLERLDFRDGNSPKGRVWQELVERFGEQVVG